MDLNDRVILQIEKDLNDNDTSSIYELISKINIIDLIAFLPEEQWGEYASGSMIDILQGRTSRWQVTLTPATDKDMEILTGENTNGA